MCSGQTYKRRIVVTKFKHFIINTVPKSKFVNVPDAPYFKNN